MDLYKILSECRLCPRECGVDRLSGETGFCGAGDKARIARADLHFWGRSRVYRVKTVPVRYSFQTAR